MCMRARGRALACCVWVSLAQSVHTSETDKQHFTAYLPAAKNPVQKQRRIAVP